MNEPSNSFPACNQEGMTVGPAKRATVITLLAQDLASQSPGTAVSADESTTSAALRSGIDEWIDPDVRSVAFHGYDYPTAAALRSLYAMVRSRSDAQFEMSEVCCSTGTSFTQGYNPGILDGLWLANTMWRDLSAGEVEQLQLVDGALAQDRLPPRHRRHLPRSGQHAGLERRVALLRPRLPDRRQPDDLLHPALLRARELQPLHPSRRRALQGRPACRRAMHVIAFLRNNWRFVLINDSAASQSVGVKLLRAPSGRSYGQPAAYTTSATSNLAPAPAPVLDSSTRTVTTTLPGRSVTTMVVPW